MAKRIQIRRDTTTNWESNNPILAEGELGLDLTTGVLKIGDGVTAWTSLKYFTPTTPTVPSNYGIVLNGGFEFWTDGVPQDWTVDGSGGNTLTQESGIVAEGGSSAKVQLAAQFNIQNFFQGWTGLTPGQTYDLNWESCLGEGSGATRIYVGVYNTDTYDGNSGFSTATQAFNPATGLWDDVGNVSQPFFAIGGTTFATFHYTDSAAHNITVPENGKLGLFFYFQNVDESLGATAYLDNLKIEAVA